MKTRFYGVVFPAVAFAIAASDIFAKDSFEPKPMDGVIIEALETYPGGHNQEIGLGVGLYPFNAYYSAMLLNANYQYSLGQSFSWEILNASYAFNFDKGLTTELADSFGVNPKTQIDRLNFLLSSNVLYAYSSGKFVFLKEHIRYFRGLVLGGVGLAKTSRLSSFAMQAGLRFEIFTSGSFSWRFDARDSLTVNGFNNYMTFTLGSAIGF